MRKHLYKTIILLSLVLSLSACAVHKPAEKYKTIYPPDKFISTSEGTPSATDTKWWYKYNDEALNTIMHDVLENNSDIEQAYFRLAQATAYSKGKSADLFPQLNINGSAKSEDSESYSSTTNTYSISLAASYELDLWGKVRSAKEAARLKREASLYDLQALYISITAQAAEFYFRASEKKKAVFLAREIVRLAKERLEVANLNYKMGVNDSSFVYSARQNLASVESALVLQEAAYRKLIHTLSILQNKYPELPDNYTLPNLDNFQESFKKGIPSDLLKNRPDIQKALAEVTAADYEIGIAVANRFPSISLTANLGETGTDLTGSIVTSTFTNIAGNLILPVLDWGKKRAEVKRVKARFNEILSAYKKSVLSGFKDAEDAIVEFKASEYSLEKIKSIETNSRAELEQKNNKYSYGLIDYYSLISSKTAAINADSRLNEARLDLLLKNISLVRALGGTWMNEDIKIKLDKEKE